MALGILTKKCETLLASSFSATDFSLLSNGFKELDGYGAARRPAAMPTRFLNYVMEGHSSESIISLQRRRDEAAGDGERF